MFKKIKGLVKSDISSNYGKMLGLFIVPGIVVFAISIVYEFIALGGIGLSSYIGSTTIESLENGTFDATMFETATPALSGATLIFSLILLALLFVTGFIVTSAEWKYLDVVAHKEELSKVDLWKSYFAIFKNKFGRTLGATILVGIIVGIIAWVFTMVFIVILTVLGLSGFTVGSENTAISATLAIAIIALFIIYLVGLIFIILPFGLTIYTLNERPEATITECIKISFKAMKGNYVKTILFELSFIGWFILAIIPVVGWLFLIFYLIPYYRGSILRWYSYLLNGEVDENSEDDAITVEDLGETLEDDLEEDDLDDELKDSIDELEDNIQ